MAPLPWRILVAATAAAALSTTSNYRTPTTSLRAAASTSSTAPTEKPTNKLARAAKFWQRAVPIVGKYVTGPVTMQLRERVLGECLSDDECEVVWDDAHASGAAQARKVVDELGGFYVKTGQIIASRSDLFPRQYSDALAGLTDLVDPMDGAYVRGIVARFNGRSLSVAVCEAFAKLSACSAGLARMAPSMAERTCSPSEAPSRESSTPRDANAPSKSPVSGS